MSIVGAQNVVLTVSYPNDKTITVVMTNVDFGVAENSAPTASPFVSGNTILANASDADNDSLVYSWAVGSTVLGNGPFINIEDAPSSIVGVQTVLLTISDGKASPVIIVIPNVEFSPIIHVNTAPTASPYQAGSALVANAIDVDGDALTYNWSVGSTIIGNAAIVDLDITPASIIGVNNVVLTISDSKADPVIFVIPDVDFGGIDLLNNPPIANPSLYNGTLLSNASDLDGDPLNYIWMVGSTTIGTSANISLDAAPASLVGLQTVTLLVNDTKETSSFLLANVDFGGIEFDVPPVVHAGSNIYATAGEAFILSGSATDIDTIASNLTYSWNINGQNYSGATVAVTIPVAASYTATLTVSDGVNSSLDSIMITVSDIALSNTAPTATPAQLGRILVANGLDVDGDALTYVWKVGNEVIGFGSNIDIYEVPVLLTGLQTVILEVSDSTQTVTYTLPNVDFDSGLIENSAPIASPRLSGSLLIANASDVDGDALTYVWKVGSTILATTSIYEIHNAPSYFDGIHNVILEVSDGAYTTVVIVPNVDFGTTNPGSAPIVNAGYNVNTTAGEAFTLSGSATDADSSASDLTYSWNINGQNYIGATVSVTLAVAGSYPAVLTVSDGVNSTLDLIIVTVNDVALSNTAPIVTDIFLSGSTLIVDAIDAETPNALTYEWLVDGVVIGNMASVDASAYTGVQIVTVTVTDPGGLSYSYSRVFDFGVTIGEPLDPVVAIIAQYDGDIALDQKATGDVGASLQTTGNPFDDSYFYLNPDMFNLMDYSIDLINDSALINKMKYIQQQPTAIWLDSTAAITQEGGDGTRATLIQHLDNALKQQSYYEEQDGGISPMSVVVVIYNLPDRNCAAFSSDGKLIQVGQDDNYYDPSILGMGYANYRDEYITPIAEVFLDPKYASLRIVAMLEPDSLPNMITNTNETGSLHQNGTINPDSASLSSDGYCDKILSFSNPTIVPPVSGEGTVDNPTLGLYADSLRLAISVMHSVSQLNQNVYTYMDIGHAGILGWDMDSDVTDAYPGYDGNENGTPDSFESPMKRTAKFYKQLVDGADGALDGKGMDWIRGFASNTSGYTPVEEPLISNSKAFVDVFDLESFYQFNSSVDEVTYVSRLNEYFTTSDPAGYFGTQAFGDIGFIIDTGRNGWGALGNARPTIGNAIAGTNPEDRVDTRVHRGHWCNVNDAGVGEVPKASPSSANPHLDAFFWMKAPGQSDGISFDVNDFQIGGPSYDALDSIDKDIVLQSNHPIYLGHKSSDTMCIPGEQRDDVTVNVVPNLAPQAGAWFHKQFIMLIENAHPPLGESDYD